MATTTSTTAFIIDKLRASFPDADYSSGSPVWRQTIIPLTEELGPNPLDLPTRAFIQAVLRTKYPNQALDRDDPIDDSLIKPAESILSPVSRAIANVRRRQSIVDLRAHTRDSLSDIAANFGIVGSEGQYARGPVRVYYTAPKNKRVAPEDYLETGSGLRFYPVGVQTITSSQMSLNTDGSLYYMDINVVAENPGTAYNVGIGRISRGPNYPEAVKISNLYKLSNGATRDNVSDIADMLDDYPTTRSIGTFRGTSALLRDQLSGLRVVETVGMGDPYMERDIIRGGEIYHEVATHPTSGQDVSGLLGSTVADETATFYTTLFEDTLTAGIDFADLFGYSLGEVTGYYLVACIDTKGVSPTWVLSPVTYVYSSTRIQIADRVLPIDTSAIYWCICPAKLTLSLIPGGILWEDTDDGEVVINDNEIHVGGCTDVHLLGSSIDSASVDLDAITDEDWLGSGGGAGTGAQLVAGSYEIQLSDMPEVVTLGGSVVLTANRVGAGLYEFPAIVWGTADLTGVKAGQVFSIPAAMGAPKDYYLIQNVGRNAATGVLQITLDADPGAGITPVTPARIIKRKVDAPIGSCLHATDAAGTNYYFKIIGEREGTSADAAPGCLYRLVASTASTVNQANCQWVFADDIDIDLTDPKVLRVFGADLVTISGSDIVSTPSTDFTQYGVQAGDILRITAGTDEGDYVLLRAPFGAGNRQLQIDSAMKASATVNYSLFASATPIQTPLLRVTELNLLDADGAATGVEIPYGEPLGAYSSQFTNLARGEKYRCTSAIVGIRTTSGIQVPAVPPQTLDLTVTPFRLAVWHENLGFEQSYTLTSGSVASHPGVGRILPTVYDYVAGSYNLSVPGNWDTLITYMNNISPFPHWTYEDVIEAGVTMRYLICRPMGASFMIFSYDNAAGSGVLTFDDTVDFRNAEEFEVTAAHVLGVDQITSKDVYVDVDVTALDVPLTIGQDLIDIYSGHNTDEKDVLLQYGAKGSRLRPHGFRAMYPEGTIGVRLGVPSTGLGRTYFKDATDYNVSIYTRYTDDTDSTAYFPDPTLYGQVFPSYPDYGYDDNGYVSAPSTFMTNNPTAINLMALLLHQEDYLEIYLRDFITTRGAIGAWPYTPPADETLIIQVDGQSPVTVTFLAGVNYAEQDAADLINSTFGSTIAVVDATPSIRLRYSQPINVTGTALTLGNTMGPETHTAKNDNYAYSRGRYKIQFPGGPLQPSMLVVLDPAPASLSALDAMGEHIQYRIVRRGWQRVCAQEMADTDGPGRLLYKDIELAGFGVGDSFNLTSDRRMTITGHECRGYRLSTVHETTSYSTAEEPWLDVDCFFQPDTVDDAPANDQTVLGSGLMVTYERSPAVASAQALLNARRSRDNNQSVLARHLYPHYVSFEVSYSGGDSTVAVQSDLEDLITGRDPNEPLDASDVIGEITSHGANHVVTPIELVVLRHKADRSLDVLVGKDRVETDRLSGFLVGNVDLTRSS